MSDDSTQDNPGVIAPPPLIYAGALAIGLFVHWLFPVKFLPRAVAHLLGRISMGISGILALTAFLEMHRAGTHVDPTQPVTTIVTRGPFRLTRNPLYLSLTLLYAGIALLVNSLWAIILLPGVLLLIRIGVINREERYLEQKFGEKYLSYKAKVRRWI
jgi:protein-S-isoprenylcysteine O-methyltransferase Ste14